METSISEYIGMAILAASILILTAQTAYGLGKQVAQKRERLLADRRVNGVLEYEATRKPPRKSNRKFGRIGSISLPTLEVRA